MPVVSLTFDVCTYLLMKQASQRDENHLRSLIINVYRQVGQRLPSDGLYSVIPA